MRDRTGEHDLTCLGAVSHTSEHAQPVHCRGLPTNTKQQLLQRAATLVGLHELAMRLKVTEPLLEAWISGDAPVPDRKLLVLADILDNWATPAPTK